MGIRHAYQTVKADDPASDVSANEWNADHAITGPVATNYDFSAYSFTGLGSPTVFASYGGIYLYPNGIADATTRLTLDASGALGVSGGLTITPGNFIKLGTTAAIIGPGSAGGALYLRGGGVENSATQAALDSTGKLALAGDLTIDTGPAVSPTLKISGADPQLILNNPNTNGGLGEISFTHGASTRWVLGSLSQASGANYYLARYNDAGQFIDYAFDVNRSTGVFNFKVQPTVNGGAMTATDSTKVLKNGDTMTGFLYIAPAGPALLHLCKNASGQWNGIVGRTGPTSNRWMIQPGDNGPETGSNVGSGFAITRYNDSGVAIDIPFYIWRENGMINMPLGGFTLTPAFADNSTRIATTEYVRLIAGSIVGTATIGDAAPSTPVQGQLWWSSLNGNLYIRYGTVWAQVNTVGT